MALFKLTHKFRGQALTEMVLVIPLLTLMLAGVIQLTLLFQARVVFDKACGDVAREYAAGTVNDSNAFSDEFWVRLGPYQKYFIRNSLSVGTQNPKPSLIDTIVQKIDSAGPIAQKLKGFVINYGGKAWTITINYSLPFSPTFILPNGISFQNQVTVLRYPA